MLTPISFREWDFEAVRAFVVTPPASATRGGHSPHRDDRQVLMHVSGTVDVRARWVRADETIRLCDARTAVLIEAGVWSEQTHVTEAAAPPRLIRQARRLASPLLPLSEDPTATGPVGAVRDVIRWELEPAPPTR